MEGCGVVHSRETNHEYFDLKQSITNDQVYDVSHMQAFILIHMNRSVKKMKEIRKRINKIVVGG